MEKFYCNEIRTHNHLVREETINHLAQLACSQHNVHWHSLNYRVQIHSKTRMWYDKNTNSKKHNFSIPYLV